MSDSEEDYGYEDDFDEKLRNELGISHTDDEEEGGSDALADDTDADEREHGGVPSSSTFLEARVSLMGSELARALDSTLRPTTSGGRMTARGGGGVVVGDINQSRASFGGMGATPIRKEEEGGVERVEAPSFLMRPSTSGSMRQSQDLFSALDLANTNAKLKESYDAYWEAVEEQFKQEQQKAEEQAQQKRMQQAEQKHLQRLKAKMARAKEAALSQTADPREAGWDSGFVFDRQLPPAHKSRPPSATFDRPSVVKAKAALNKALGKTNTDAPPSSSPTSHTTSTSSLALPANAKPLPPAPSGILDPSRIKSVVQTHMPSYVLSKLAHQRGHHRLGGAKPVPRLGFAATSSAVAKSRSRKGSISTKRSTMSRQSSKQSLASGSGKTDDEDALFSEEISPPASSLRTASSSASIGTASSSSSSLKPRPRNVSSAKPTRSSALSATTKPARAASAGHVKPTHATMLLAAERQAQAQAAQQDPDIKQMPMSKYLRMKKEIEDLRSKVARLEAEYADLRAKVESPAEGAQLASSPSTSSLSATSFPSRSRSSSTSSTTGSSKRSSLVPSSTRTKSSVLSATMVPSTTATTHTAPLTSNTGTSAASSTVQLKDPRLKLNLAALRIGEEAEQTQPPPAASPSASPAPIPAPLAIPSPRPSPTSSHSNSSMLMSPRARCAVSSCGVPRVSGKPYCARHLAEQNDVSSSLTSPRRPSLPPAEPEFEHPSSSPPVPPLRPGGGLPKFNLQLGGGPPVQYDYGYESDENFGGTDVDDDDDEESWDIEGSMESTKGEEEEEGGENDGHTARASPSHLLPPPPQTIIEEDEEFGFNGGDTQRERPPSRSITGGGGGNTARMSARKHPPGLEDFTPRQSNLSSTAALPSSLHRDRSQHISSSTSSSHNALYSARDSFELSPSTARSSATPRMVPPKPSLGGGLEALRASPYANIDALGGSFEITQSGTFRRGGFSLNKQGMMSSPEPESEGDMEVQQYTQRDTARPGTAGTARAFDWEQSMQLTARAQQQAGMDSARSHRSTLSSGSSSSTASASASPPTPALSPALSPTFRPLHASDLYTLNVLGRGSSGVVYRCFYAPTVELLAVKAISIVEKDKRKQLTQELRTLTMQPNPYTIGFRGAYFDEQHIYIALEYMDRGALDDLREQEGTLSEIELAYIFEQVLRGLKHLHKQRIIHRDIKPHNILYNSKGHFKLTDFGIISDLKDRAEQQQMAEAKTFVGTLLYMSPERIGGDPYSYACDIWSMALSLLTCRVGHFAIPHNSHWELVNAIKSGPDILKAYNSTQVSDTLRDLLSHCLRTNPSERPTAAECLHHPFFSKFRVNGPTRSIPRPAGFPPSPPSHSSSISGDSQRLHPRNEKEERRWHRDQEIEQRNQRHMVEQVCKLLVNKGMTSRRAKNAEGVVSSTPLPAPIDPRLFERICQRLTSLLQVPLDLVQSTLEQEHNRYVGLA